MSLRADVYARRVILLPSGPCTRSLAVVRRIEESLSSAAISTNHNI